MAARGGGGGRAPRAGRGGGAGGPRAGGGRGPGRERRGGARGAAAAGDARVAVASCSALKKGYRARRRQSGGVPVHFVLLDPARDELERRMTTRAGHFMPPTLLTSQLNTLERPQPDERALPLDGSESIEAACEKVIAWLKAHG